MRYIMKGGVWKNSEDEILKAAIMKYGLNQWSRISSLLQRKSAKQCKQRWYQWLDPSIKKTQWSKVEDQKLLHLARIFPSQWRTIAPFVGRTPTQCFQRYEKLLDQAQGKSGQQTEDLKRLRPGQIDPNPETKPARLDPIDMDEDEKEMLAQVRVRLANTKGKKAKRKEREKIIEEARRLAQLQKIRELEMAGVENIPTAKQIKRMRQKQDIDYNKDIPFKRDVPQFVYKLESNQTTKNAFFASTISLQTLEGKRRDVQQELLRKIDKKRIKRLKDTDYRAMMNLKNKFDKPVSASIQLPEPQLNEKDLEEMKKYNITTPLNSLIHNTPAGMTPDNKIMLSARINFSLNHRDMMTPVGQAHDEDQVDGVDGLNYLKQIEKKERDPNKLRSVDRIISQRVKTPLSQDWTQDQNRVKSLFKNLRKPQNQIEFQIPEEEEEQEKQQEDLIDAEQAEKKQEEIRIKSREERLSLRNQALKKNLQRVKKIPTKFTPSSTNEIDQLIQREMLNMIYSDSMDYPLEACHLPEQHKLQYVSALPLQRRKQAQDLIDLELSTMNKYEEQKYLQAYSLSRKHLTIDSKNKVVNKTQKIINQDDEEKQNLYKQLTNIPLYVIDRITQKQLQKSNEQLQKKTKKFLGGYEKLISTKIEEVNNLQQQLQNLRMLRETLQLLSQHESSSAAKRLEKQESFYKIIYNSI